MTPSAMNVTPPVDIDELVCLAERCQSIAFGLQIIISGGDLSDGAEKESLCFEMACVIEESAKRAKQLAAAL